MDKVNEITEAVGGVVLTLSSTMVLLCITYCCVRQMSSAMWAEDGIPALLPHRCCQLAGGVPMAPASTCQWDGKFGYAQVTLIVCFQQPDFGKGPGSICITTFRWQRDRWEGMGREGKGEKKGNPQKRNSYGWLLTTDASCEGKALSAASGVNQVSPVQPYGSAWGWRWVLQCGYYCLCLAWMNHRLIHLTLQCVWSWFTNGAGAKSSCAGLTSALSCWDSELGSWTIFTQAGETSCQVNLNWLLRAALKRNSASLT